jgi:Protein of unknown function (DUF2510)
MGAPLPPPGWYPDPSGTAGLRWFDGYDWTPHAQPLHAQPQTLSEAERSEILDETILKLVARMGDRVETRTATSAVMVVGKPTNHILHLLLTVFTCGLWLPLWEIEMREGGERRHMLEVDPFGVVVWDGKPQRKKKPRWRQ